MRPSSTSSHQAGGCYPRPGDYQEAAESFGFELRFERDATRDYYLTSQQWARRLQEFVREHPDFIGSFAWRLFVHDPRYFFHAVLYWFYDSWTWQFRGGAASPMQHLWLMFEAPSRVSGT